MRKIIVQDMITVDGFFAGPKGEIDWHMVDDEFNEEAIKFLTSIDTLMFGRVTYDLMASYWPTSEGVKDNEIVARHMNSLAKIVFSKTMQKADWNNSKVLSDINKEEILKMKEQPGKDIAIFGSGVIVSQLADLGLIDEYRLMTNPVILVKGRTLFEGMKDRLKLKLTKTRSFKNGNVLNCYTK